MMVLVGYVNTERAVKQLGKSVTFEPLPSCVLRVFEKQLKGHDSSHSAVEPDLSQVDQKLVSSLLTFQREAVL